MIALSMLLTACAATNEPSVLVPVDLARGPCRPAASLMVAPQPLPPIAAGDRMAETVARDTARFNALRRVLIDLQAFVSRECQ